MEKQNMKNLNTRQWRTYEFIKNNSLNGKKSSQKDIYENYSNANHPDGYVWKEKGKSHDSCTQVWNDINVINANDEIHKIIIWDNKYNYWIANDENEVKEFCENLYMKKAKSKLWRYGNLMRKVKRNGQGRIIFDSKSQARTFWETFLNNSIDDLVKLSVENGDIADE